MGTGNTVVGVRRMAWLIAIGFALISILPTGSEARAAGPFPPSQAWTEQTPVNHPAAMVSNSMAFDPSTGETVLFGGSTVSAANNQTWVWDGTDWTRKFPAHNPFPRTAASMAYDKSTGNILLFGGTNTGAYYRDTWSWDGTDWTELNPATDPSERYGAGMAYDSGTGEIVMFGGARDTQSSGGGVYLNDTWTWNGTNWTQESPANQPPAGLSGRMAFDPGLGRVLAYGMFTETTSFRQTWTWNGANWSQIVTTNSPAISNGALMDYDPALGRMLLFGGAGLGNSTWTFDGSDWTLLATPQSPPVRTVGAMSFDPSAGRMLLFGGLGSGGGARTDTWYFGPPAGVGSGWFQPEPAVSPPVRAVASMAFDPASGETVLFGGSASGTEKNDTWTWDGSTWTQESPATSPSARSGAAMAFDPSTGKVVMFGGFGQGAYLNQTWTWDGSTWTQQFPATSPSARDGASLAYDEASGEMVLFGGQGGPTASDETWIWTGTNWVQRAPANKPAGRRLASMSFDQSSGKIVLFGGATGENVALDDTWTWNGTNWTQQNPTSKPFPLFAATMAFYPVAGYTMLFGGFGPGLSNTTWVWDGSNWFQADGPGDTPLPRYAAAMDFDPTQGEMMLFGGQTETGIGNDTWTYSLRVGPPTAQIADPVHEQEVPLGTTHETTFSCEEAPGGPGVASCVDEYGANAPNGQLPEATTAGYHFYTVNVTSESGQSSSVSVEYEVPKAEADLSANLATSGSIGETISVSADLSNGYEAGGDITFLAYGPDDATCSGDPAFESSAVAVSGDGTYDSPGFTPAETGVYRWVADYSGDENNDDETSVCGEAGTVSTIAKAQPALITGSATDAEVGGPVAVNARLEGGSSPGGEITFRAYGPDAANCDGTPAFDSSATLPPGAVGMDSPAFTPTEPGAYRWVAAYSGDENNVAATSECGQDGSISTVTAVPPPPNVCPASLPGLRMTAFGLKPPFGSSNRVMGVRIRLISNQTIAQVEPSMVSRINGKKKRFKLKSRTVTIGKQRNLRFRVPSEMKRAIRKAGLPLNKAKVTFVLKGKIRHQDSPEKCFADLRTNKVNTRVTWVSGRVALRSRR